MDYLLFFSGTGAECICPLILIQVLGKSPARVGITHNPYPVVAEAAILTVSSCGGTDSWEVHFRCTLVLLCQGFCLMYIRLIASLAGNGLDCLLFLAKVCLIK